MKNTFSIKLHKVLAAALVFGTSQFYSCLPPEEDEAINAAPELSGTLEDLELEAGFGTATYDLSSAFSDQDGDALSYEATSSDETVVTTAMSSSTLTLTDKGPGSSTITISVTDGEAFATGSFLVSVIAPDSISDPGDTTVVTTCDNDNSLETTLWECDESAKVANSYEEIYTDNGERIVNTNGIPGHDYRNQIPELVSSLNSETKSFTMTLMPSLANSATSITDESYMPKYRFGVALNGVPLDPAPATPFIFEDTETGEYNWDWVMEPTNNTQDVGLDCATAHVQPDGTYHYHGDMIVYAEELMSGLGTGSTTPSEPIQIGWAADGFPVYYKYGYNTEGKVVKLTSSYQIKSGDRPGDGVSEPCGEYNGKYTNDYEYVQGVGDLDECNGYSYTVNVGNFSYDYFYVVTDEFPVISRCISGTPHDSFLLNSGGGMNGPN